MRQEVIASQPSDAAKIASNLVGPIPGGKPIWYQKHMTLHMIPEFDCGFMRDLTNVFLIRHPARVVASYSKKREQPTLADIGFVQQAELFDQVADWLGHAPLVIDSADIRADPPKALGRLCAALGIPFTQKMLHWSAGPKPFDGIWASHWYNAVHASVGFDAPEGPLPELAEEFQTLVDAALPYYDRLRRYC
jgi:hypothetical protein